MYSPYLGVITYINVYANIRQVQASHTRSLQGYVFWGLPSMLHVRMYYAWQYICYHVYTMRQLRLVLIPHGHCVTICYILYRWLYTFLKNVLQHTAVTPFLRGTKVIVSTHTNKKWEDMHKNGVPRTINNTYWTHLHVPCILQVLHTCM